MLNRLKLKSAIGPSYNTQPNDVLSAKATLQELGLYEAPDWGVTDVPDRALFEAIKTFQKGTGLKTDGVMNPGGETETTLKTAAELVRRHGRYGDTILAHITPAEAELLDRVTDGGSINPDTGLPEFFLGSALGAVASSFLGPGVVSFVGNVGGQMLGNYAAQKISKKVGGPMGQILGGTVGGFLGNGSYTDIGGGLKNAFTSSVGNYAAGKVSDTIGGPLGSTIGNALGSSLQSGLSDSIDAMGPKSSQQAGTISGALSDQFATQETKSYHTPGINGGVDSGVPRNAPKRTQSNTTFGTPRQTSTINDASLMPKVPESKSNPILKGPLGPLKNPLTGAYFRANDFKPPKQPKQRQHPFTFSDATRQRVKSAQAAANNPSRAQDTVRNRTMDMNPAKPGAGVQEVWSGPKAHLNKPKAQPLSAESASAVARDGDALLKKTDFTDYKRYAQDALKHSGPQAEAELKATAEYMYNKDPELGAKFAREMELPIGPDPFKQESLIGPGVQAADNTGSTREYLPVEKHPNGAPTIGREQPKKSIEDVIGEITNQYPDSKIRVTGKARTVQRQAELMAERRMKDRKDFIGTYTNHPHVLEMDKWV